MCQYVILNQILLIKENIFFGLQLKQCINIYICLLANKYTVRSLRKRKKIQYSSFMLIEQFYCVPAKKDRKHIKLFIFNICKFWRGNGDEIYR